ncbi:MAG: TIGR00282 family metallophosphoesterase, partial [Sphingobacteriia bacterium]
VQALLPGLITAHRIDFVVCNGENSHEGRGINEVICKRLHKAGVDVITGGDHSFDKHLIFPYMARHNTLLRPANYPKGAPGQGFGLYETAKGIQVGVINLRGNTFFQNPVNCPFTVADRLIQDLGTHAQVIFMDFHAEATAEKKAMGWYVDGRISALCGTHTHVQTADEQVLPHGTGYLTDAGFTGPHHSVIGMDIETAITRFRIQIPQRYKLAEEAPMLHAAIFDLDEKTGKTRSIQRLSEVAKLEIPAGTEAQTDTP